MLKKAFLGVLFAVLASASIIVEIDFNMTKAVNYSGSETPTAGVISQNTTWTLENSPYLFVDDVTVAPGVTLTIEPGVTVDLDFWNLKVDGTLHAVGNALHRVKLQTHEGPLSGNARIHFSESSTGCIIEYAEIDLYGGGGYGIREGSPKISNNVMRFIGCDAGIIATDDSVISNNTIIVNAYRGIITNGNASILHNIIAGGYNSDVAIGVEGNPIILGNLITNFQSYVGRAALTFYGGKPYIANNTILKSIRALSFSDFFDPSELNQTRIVFNNIYGNVEVWKMDPRVTINITYNWWGTTNTSLIDNRILDQTDDRRLCLMNYTPFLTSPSMAPANLTYPIHISSIIQEPERDKVEPYQEVTVKANVTDQIVGVGQVILEYYVNGSSTANHVAMIYNETSRLYEAIIPQEPENTVVEYSVVAWDKFADHYARAPVYCIYTVIPEFPSIAILLILLIFLTLVIILATRKVKVLRRGLGRLAQLNQSKVYLFWKRSSY